MTTSEASHQPAFTPRPREMQLLLVEDNPGDIRLAQEAFKAGGDTPQVRVVRDGEEALRFLRKQAPFEDAPRPDLVLLDLNLPKVNGSEVLRAVKSDPDLKRIPIIVWTTARSASEIAAAYELHANCCVTKPFGIDAFFKLIQAAQHFWFDIATLPSR